MPKKKQSSSMNVPPKWIGQDKRFAETLKENLDVLAGHRGDPLDAAITARDLLESGIIKLSAGANFYSGSSQDIIANALIPDLLIPPAPYNLAANGAFQNILLTWNIELYSGHAFFEIFRHTSDVISSATLVGTQSGLQGIYSDSVGGGQTYYYWVRAVNLNDIRGPFNSSTGTLGQTQPDIGLILGILTDQITTSQLATSLTTPIALIPSLSGSIAELDAYTGLTDAYTGANLLSRINSTEVVASTTTSAVATINSSLSTLNATVSNLQGSVADLTSGVSAVYVQASQPTGTITTNSRWYDNDDNMKPYFYNGTAWIALDDPRIASNQVSINSLNAQVFNGDGTVKVATASALNVLDATVVVQGNNITSVSADVTALNNSVYNADGTLELATSSALSTLSGTVTTQGNTISTVQTDITDLEGEVFNADGSSKLATGSALSGLTNSVTAIYDGTNASVVKSVQTNVTALEGEVFNADGSSKLATGSALSGLTNSVTAIYDGTNASVVKSVQTDVSSLEGEVFKADGSARLATGSALTGVSNSVSAIYDGTNASVVKSVQVDVTALEGEVFNADGTARLATTTVTGGLSNSITAIYDDGNPSVVKTVQGDVTNLKAEVFSGDGTSLLATLGALSGVTQSVEAIYNPSNANAVTQISAVQSDISDLNNTVFTNGGVALATTSALGGIANKVTAIYDADNGSPSVVTVLQSDISDLNAVVLNANGTSKVATGLALASLTNDVEAIYNGSETSLLKTVQESLVTLNGAIYNEDGTAKLADATATSLLQTEVWGTGVDPAGATSSRIDSLSTTLNDPSSGLSVTADSVSTLKTEVFPNGFASASRIDGLSSAVFDDAGAVKLATALAFGELHTEVFGTSGSAASRIDGLQAVLFDDEGKLKMASAGALEELNVLVTGDNAIATKVSRLAASMYVDSDTDGVLNLATAADFERVETQVFPNGNTNASRISQLSAALWDGGDPTGELTLATADYAEEINLAIFGSRDNQSASANKLEQLQVTVAGTDGAGGLTAAINTTQDIVANANTGLTAQYAVKIDSGNGAISGFGLSNTTNSEGSTTSAFIVSADRFAIMDPNGGPLSDPNNPNSGTASVPFSYTDAQPASADTGNVAIPAGVYIDTAFIKTGSITTAMIGNATIDTAHITGQLSANKIGPTGSIDTALLNIDGSSLTSQTIGGVSTLVLGDVNVNKLVGNSISASIMSGTSVFANKLSGDVNTLIPFRSFANQAYTGSETTMIEVDLPASSHPLGHKPFAMCTGYMEPIFERVYRFKMYMKTAVAVTTVLGSPLVSSFNYYYPIFYRYVIFAGDRSDVISTGQLLYTYMDVKSATVTNVSVASNQTTVQYTGDILATSDSISTRSSTDYVLVGETRTKSRTATRLMFSLTGSKSVPDTGVVGMKVTVTQMNSQDTGFDTQTSGVRINEVSGMIMGVR